MAKKTTKKTTRKKTTKKSSTSTRSKKKTTKKPSSRKPEVQISEGLMRRLIDVLVVEGVDRMEIRQHSVFRGYSEEEVEAHLVEADVRLHAVASFDRNREIGEAILRLKSLFAKANGAGELTAAIQAQTQIAKLLALYPKRGEGEGNTTPDVGFESMTELEQIAQHLRPLKLAPDTYPLSELARVAAEQIIRFGT